MWAEPVLPRSMWSDLLCPVKTHTQKKTQLEAYYGMLGGAPGMLGRSVLILQIAAG